MRQIQGFHWARTQQNQKTLQEGCAGKPGPKGFPEEDSGESREEAHESAQDDCQLESFQA